MQIVAQYLVRKAAEAYIRCKSQYGSEYCEASIFIGHLELLVVGGFFGNTVSDVRTGFLGSSIQNLAAHMKRHVEAESNLMTHNSWQLLSL
ncbi:hypothetical protein VTP01DRAFT_6373 [Rhizomucor pusillus]|uniref:uncharacterized protein n=1 Tax=Rhizomucor pusillus TaxID=4840 RepID=UPI0037429AB9